MNLTSPSLCDWCGEPLSQGETPVPGYGDEPTHRKCQRDARRAYRLDRDRWEGVDDSRPEREPFNDWPNGQGVYE